MPSITTLSIISINHLRDENIFQAYHLFKDDDFYVHVMLILVLYFIPNCLLFRSVHSVCLWDEQGANKLHTELQNDILDFIKQAQAVSKVAIKLFKSTHDWIFFK